VSFLVRRLNERAEYDCVDWEAAWRAASDQAKEYIEKHAEERKARKEADAELAALRATIAEQAATIARLEGERDTGKAFHDVAVKERDYERRMRDKAEAERDALRARVAELEARDIPDATLDELVGWSFRYGLGRQSYAVGMIAEAVRTYRQRLLPQTRARLMREIEEAIHRGGAGMACDVREWEAVHAALQEEQP
jgi:hypothetical protein